ncbi:hypothetical protein [Desulfoluna spongiiphila]|uniref:Roadblock/LAMTOR2 domain-containing protein n=1 Tax=Desulfoluna spongiiphila TaxID=419481 RepID=A0A1G5AFY5_9BACT|nr:hypothetical protein [Desulfoluna spongiiphila]SCX76783.1 hypothetical protein SAMN05216233_101149 [Desulfoluna spongiiphila]VVS90623.1 hypothetical protein DBB_1900 [Desulfoluna spongiiphila]
MDAIKQDRRFNRSDTRQESLTNLLNYSKIYGGFDHAIIIHRGDVVAKSNQADQFTRMKDIALILEKSAGYLSKAAAYPDIQTMVAQTSRGDSVGCYFFKSVSGAPCAIVVLSKTRIPPSADKIFARTATGYERIMRTTST